MNIKLVQTCGACPEQYDAYLDGKRVGYLRLRHGYFRVECYGEIVFESYPKGDGCFDIDERERYLKHAKRAIMERLLENV